MDAFKFLDEIKAKALPVFLDRISNNDKYIIDGEKIKLAGEFFSKQTRIALKNYEIIDPESIEEYIANGGYYALAQALFTYEPIEIINIIIDSNLRGRGGAGFPTGKKWKGAYDHDADTKYVICNADEGDPGAYMDRSILEGDPHSVIEGMAICARAIGANKGYVYVRAEYPKAVEALKIAINKAKEHNLLGKNILGTDFSFDLEIRLGAGAFVCGEGTALIKSIEGERGMPRAKVFRTTHKGLFDLPTVVNNVETLANIAQIITNGAAWYKSIGTEDSPGTKVFALVGKVKHAGLVEVPMGVTINDIVFGIGGGIINDNKVKAVQTGGPSGGCIPSELFDTKVDFISLEKIGSIMGSGGMVVMDEHDCMVDIAKFFMQFTVDESCGKCTPCRVGNKRVLTILQKITSGKAEMKDLEILNELNWVISETSLCGLGKTATTPVSSSIRYFKDEYIEHIKDHKCKAAVCKELLDYVIQDKCVGCSLCKSGCPVNAITGEKREKHFIDTQICIKCDTCRSKCPVKAIELR